CLFATLHYDWNRDNRPQITLMEHLSVDNLASYKLVGGAVHHWLTYGPVTSPLTALRRVLRPDGPVFGEGGRWILNYWAYDPASAALKQQIYAQLPPLKWKPGPRPTLHAPGIDGKRWEYAVAEEDHVIDFSLFNFAPRLMQGWLFACLKV